MSEKNINRMDFKELRNEVQLLRDELAKMKRSYEDAINNLDNDNFSQRIVKEKNGMKTAITVNAQAITTKISRYDLVDALTDYSTTEQTAEAIRTTVNSTVDAEYVDSLIKNDYVKNETLTTKLLNYSTIEQTSEAVTSTVTKEYINDLVGDDYVTNQVFTSQIKQTSEQIQSKVSQSDLETQLEKYSTVKQTSEAIKTTVTSTYVDNLIKGDYVKETALDEKLSGYSTVEQTAEKITSTVDAEYVNTLIDGKYVTDAVLTSKIEQASDSIISTVSTETDEKLTKYSTIEQTSNTITSTVTASYIDTLIDGEYVKNADMVSEIEQSSEGILSTVSKNYETIDNANSEYLGLWDSISSFEQTAEEIRSTVTDVKDEHESIFTQTAYGFTLDGEQTTFTGVIYLTDANNNKRFSFFLDNSQGYEQVMMHSITETNIPIVLGDKDSNVYIGSDATGYEVATRKWVRENVGGSGGTVVAVFG